MVYNCPSCHCSALFEENGRLVCQNCGATCTKSAARAARHVHGYETYQKSAPARDAEAPGEAPSAEEKLRNMDEKQKRRVVLLVTLGFFLFSAIMIAIQFIPDKTQVYPEYALHTVLWSAEEQDEELPPELVEALDRFCAAHTGPEQTPDPLTLLTELQDTVLTDFPAYRVKGIPQEADGYHIRLVPAD